MRLRFGAIGPAEASGDVIRVFLADGTFKNVRVDANTTVRRIIDVVLNALGVDRLSVSRFALRLNACQASTSGADSDDCHWLHPTLRFAQLAARYVHAAAPTAAAGSNVDGPPFRFELRIRFLAGNVLEMYQTEMVAFLYLYEQLTTDYLRHVAWKIGASTALEMAALIIRKRFPNLNKENVEKKLDFVAIEREGGFSRYLPETLVINTKRKQLQKTLIAEVRRVAGLSELECVFRFMRRLADVTPFDVEVFRASFGPKWQNPVDVHIGPGVGIAYLCENTRALIKLAALRDVCALCVRRVDLRVDSTALVELRLLADAVPLILTLPTMNIAESLAHLIDGYRITFAEEEGTFVTASTSDEQNGGQLSSLLHNYNPTIKNTAIFCDAVKKSPPPASSALEALAGRARRRASPDPTIMRALGASQNALASKSAQDEFAVHDIQSSEHVDTRDLRLQRLIGGGQFGNVCSAFYTLPGETATIPVAVKVCKTVSDPTTARAVNEYLRDEARAMAQFRHPHVISLIGTASENGAVWLIMELAAGGELRGYLQRERGSLTTGRLVAFSRQLADALAYLHRQLYVHGDVAARNCLVASAADGCCLKLSDFGLSRRLAHEDDVCTAPHGKLPIKWLPPESIYQRAFSTASDVFMFGVCTWEIFSLGGKPWPGVRNHEVIARVERGERPRKPDACPEAVYALMMACWSAAPVRRPRAGAVFEFLTDISIQLDNGSTTSQLKPGIFSSRLNEKQIVGDVKKSQQTNLSQVECSEMNKDNEIASNSSAEHQMSSNRPNENDDEISGNNRQTYTATVSEPIDVLAEILEAQRAACAADDRWLEEEESRWGLAVEDLPEHPQRCQKSVDRSFNKAFNVKNRQAKESAAFDLNKSKSCSLDIVKTSAVENKGTLICQRESKSDSDTLPTAMKCDNASFEALVQLISAICVMSEGFDAKMSDDKFAELVKNVSDKCNAYLMLSELIDGSPISESEERFIQDIDQKRLKVSLMRRLVESDARKFHAAAAATRRVDALREAHAMAVDGRSLLEAHDAVAGGLPRRAASAATKFVL